VLGVRRERLEDRDLVATRAEHDHLDGDLVRIRDADEADALRAGIDVVIGAPEDPREVGGDDREVRRDLRADVARGRAAGVGDRGRAGASIMPGMACGWVREAGS